MTKYLDNTGLSYLWGKITSLFATKSELSYKVDTTDLADVATSGSYTDLIDAPQYVICTLSAYNAMESHDSDTYYIIIADSNA